MVHSVIEEITSFDLEAMKSCLSAQRREQVDRYRPLLQKRQCALSYVVLCRLLSLHHGIDGTPSFSYSADGKPFLSDYPSVHFNISHCREAVACAVSDSPVGIDVESIREYKQDLAEYVLNEKELSCVLSSDNPAFAFTRLWTRKEAVLKLRGTGIREDLKHVLDDVSDVKFEEVITDSYICTICEYIM